MPASAYHMCHMSRIAVYPRPALLSCCMPGLPCWRHTLHTDRATRLGILSLKQLLVTCPAVVCSNLLLWMPCKSKTDLSSISCCCSA
jgi:hypothetical protein